MSDTQAYYYSVCEGGHDYTITPNTRGVTPSVE